MKRLRLYLVYVLFVASTTVAVAEEMDKALSVLANDLAVITKDNGKKKVTVLDFTDLQGIDSELGKYIAEELTVDLVIAKKEFAVLDRANLRKILAEHKLTATGLVDPENAKKLGQFAGVDALILGTIIPKGENVGLTAKLITTDTAEIVGATKSQFALDDFAKKLFNRAASPSDAPPNDTSPEKAKPLSQQFGDLSVTLTKVHRAENFFEAQFLFRNTHTQHPIAVAVLCESRCFLPPCSLRSAITADDGTTLGATTSSVNGIRAINSNPKYLTEIEPAGEIKASIFYGPEYNRSKSFRSFNLQAELILNGDYKASAYDGYQPKEDVLPPGCKMHNLVFEIPLTHAK